MSIDCSLNTVSFWVFSSILDWSKISYTGGNYYSSVWEYVTVKNIELRQFFFNSVQIK